MTQMRVATVEGMVLTYDTNDVEAVHIETPHDVRDVGATPKGYVKRELGQAHLVVRVDFEPGKRPLWVNQADAALPDLRSAGRFLTAALAAEGIDPELASRIYNRFFFGDPRGVNAPPLSTDEVDELRAQQQLPPDFPRLAPLGDTPYPAGQTAGERMAAMVKAAGFGPVPERVEVTYERAAHRCDERCVCRADGKPMYYAPSTGQHACQDPNCRYAHPDEEA